MFATLIRPIFDLLFPPNCVACNRDGAWICGPCLATVNPVWRTHPTPDVDRLLCLGSYDHPLLGQAVQRLKYHGGHALAEPLGRTLSDHLPSGISPATIVPVPLHRSRQRERGFNQSRLLAASVAASTGLACREIVYRKRRTLSQVTLGEADRQLNVGDAFALIPGLEIIPKHVIIVDDVFTTGATISAVARVLRTAGTTDVTAVTVAKG